MSASCLRWATCLLLGLAVCNVSHSREPRVQLADGAAIPNARLIAAAEAKAIEELQQLALSDPSRVHATALRTHNRMGWKWRVYLPPNKDWVIKGAIGHIPGRGHQPQERDIISHEIERLDQSRILELEGHISRDPFDGWSLIVEEDRSIFSGIEFAAWDLHRTADSEVVVDYVIGNRKAASLTTFSVDIGRVATYIKDDLELVRWRYTPKDSPSSPGPDQSLPGFVLWIESK